MRVITAAIATVVLLAGCGGGSSSSPSTTGPTNTSGSSSTDNEGTDTSANTTATAIATTTAPATTAVAEEGDEGDLLDRFKEYDRAFGAGDSAAVYDMYSAACRDKYSRGEYSTLVEVAHATIREFFDLEPNEVHNSDPKIDFAGNSAELTYDLLGPDDKPLIADQPTTATWIFEDGEWVRDSCDFDESLGVESSSNDDTSDGDGTGPGTRDNPIPIGETAEIGDGWSLTINSVVIDAAAEVAAANEFNETAPDGQQFVLIEVTAAYNGDQQSSSAGIDVKALGEGTNNPVASYDANVVPPEPQFVGGELFQGGEETGFLVFLIDSSDADTLVFFGQAFTSFDDSDRKFFAAS